MRLEDGSEGGGDVGNTGAVPETWPVGAEDSLRACRAEMRRGYGGLCVARRVVVREARCARGALAGTRARRMEARETRLQVLWSGETRAERRLVECSQTLCKLDTVVPVDERAVTHQVISTPREKV